MSDEITDLVRHSDLEERLRDVPPSAKVRGLYFKNTLAVLRRADRLEAHQRYFPQTYSAVRWYSCQEFLQHLAVAGALLEGAEEVHRGMRRIGQENAASFADSLLGRTMLRLLSNDPVKLLRQATAGRRQSYQYGRWEVDFPEPGLAIMSMFEEYIWIESNLRGAAEGTFQSIGRNVRVDVELDSPFQGRHFLRWDP